MALLTTVQISKPSWLETLVAVSASDTITADPTATLILMVTNGGGSSDTVTISDSGVTPGGNAAAANTVAVANGTTRWIPILPQYVNPATGLVTVTHSFTTSVTCAVLRLS